MTRNLDKIKEIIASDKRKCDRLERPLKIRYTRSSGEQGLPDNWSDFLWLDNIGGEGLGFRDNIELSKGENLEIELHLPQVKSPIYFGVEVMWVSRNFRPEGEAQSGDFSYGLKIVRLAESDYKQFVRFISDSLLDEYLDDNGKLKETEG